MWPVCFDLLQLSVRVVPLPMELALSWLSSLSSAYEADGFHEYQ